MRSRFELPLAALLCALLATMAVAGTEVPVPPPSGPVVDLAGILDEGSSRRLAELIRAVRERTAAEIAVLTVPTTAPLGIQEYSMAVFDRWKIGQRGQDNGLLFLVAVGDRRFHITTGYGLEGILPDGRLGEIRDRFILPAFRQGRLAEGIVRGTEAMASVLVGEAPAAARRPAAARPGRGWGGSTTGALLVIFLALILASAALSAAQRPAGRAVWGRSRGDAGDLLALLAGLLLGGRGRRGGGWPGGGWSGGGFSSGGFGGFGGGSSGGGGAGGSW